MSLDGRNWTQTETKPGVFSLEGLIAWLELQPPETEYKWAASACDGGCLIHRYLITHGSTIEQAEEHHYNLLVESFDSCRTLDIKVAMACPHTYGAAFSRARALLAERRK